ncbi:MAG: recombinase family protein [Oscillospiraceae bacterium]|nr:recombinase family protein [Oscillospiraceae bacterium]
MKNIYGYTRVSTEEQAIHGLSIEAQAAALEEWAKANSCKLAGIYTDAGISARKPASKRPALQQLLAEVRTGKVDLIVFTKLDRWFRNIAEYYKVQEVLEKHHVDWKTIHEDYDTSTASGRLKINIMLSVAQDEADRTSERIKAVFEAKRMRQEALSGKAPIGYKVENKKLVKDPDKEDLVISLFRKFMACGSMSETQQYIVDNYSLHLKYQLISKVLQNPTYYGTAYGVEGMAPPYITKQQFDQIQKMRKKTVRKTKYDRVYFYSGLILCGECGLRMIPGTNHSSPNPFYKCRQHSLDHTCGNRVCMNEKKLETYLLERLAGEFQKYKVESEQIAAANSSRNCKAELSAIRAKIAKLKNLYLDDLITLAEYKADYAAFAAKLEELSKIAQPAKRPNQIAVEHIIQGDWRTDYEDIGRPDKRDFWRVLIREIRIYPDRKITFELNV